MEVSWSTRYGAPMTRLALASLITSSLVAAACGGKATSNSSTPVATTCPASVTATVSKTYPDGKLGACHSEHEDGKDIYEVMVTAPSGEIEVELSTDGVITQTEQVVTAMPDPVAKAFAAKYPGEQVSRIERITHPGKGDTFEVKFGAKEATFTDAGEFVEEEAGDADKD